MVTGSVAADELELKASSWAGAIDRMKCTIGTLATNFSSTV